MPTVFPFERRTFKLRAVVREKLYRDESGSVKTLGRERTQEAIVRPLWNWTKHRERRSEPGTSDGVRILLISCDADYRDEWRRIFDRRGWELECTPLLEGALNTLRTRPAPVVVYDSQAADEDWREVLRALGDLPHGPCILLASSVIDEGFRDEVVRLHGYDVLSRQADEDEIARTINSAWFWKHRNA